MNFCLNHHEVGQRLSTSVSSGIRNMHRDAHYCHLLSGSLLEAGWGGSAPLSHDKHVAYEDSGGH